MEARMSDMLLPDEEGTHSVLLNDAEHQLIEMLREQHMEPGFRLVIERVNEGWELSMNAVIGVTPRSLRGAGETFELAWDNMYRAMDWE
jgi:hypothetical protein